MRFGHKTPRNLAHSQDCVEMCVCQTGIHRRHFGKLWSFTRARARTTSAAMGAPEMRAVFAETKDCVHVYGELIYSEIKWFAVGYYTLCIFREPKYSCGWSILEDAARRHPRIGQLLVELYIVRNESEYERCWLNSHRIQVHIKFSIGYWKILVDRKLHQTFCDPIQISIEFAIPLFCLIK